MGWSVGKVRITLIGGDEGLIRMGEMKDGGWGLFDELGLLIGRW